LILTDLLRGKRRSAARSEQGGREDFQFLTPDHAAKERTPSESLEVSGRTVIIKRVGYICIPAIVLAAVILFVTFLNKQLHIPDEQGDLASTMSRTVLREGADAKLSAGASNVLMVAVDDRSLNEVIDAISRKDDQKMKRLLQSGKAFNVEQGVKVRLLGLVGGKVMVKIMEGSNASKVGWVIEGWLK
jgi:hypothetical protein